MFRECIPERLGVEFSGIAAELDPDTLLLAVRFDFDFERRPSVNSSSTFIRRCEMISCTSQALSPSFAIRLVYRNLKAALGFAKVKFVVAPGFAALCSQANNLKPNLVMSQQHNLRV